jgi:hypothetical protein
MIIQSTGKIIMGITARQIADGRLAQSSAEIGGTITSWNLKG